jgi:adenosylcobinamide kinase/adenosylcobinamide-phosphate guanylyltransferase
MKILLTGGSACGKSTYAETLAIRLHTTRYYLATMRPYDEECLAKIAKHRRQRRDAGFETIERPTDLAGVLLPQRGVVLLECMCNWLANEMFDIHGRMRDPFENILAGLAALERRADHLIVVTNEVGAEYLVPDAGTRAYVRTLGRINALLAARCDTVLELVCGIPLVLKGELI